MNVSYTLDYLDQFKIFVLICGFFKFYLTCFRIIIYTQPKKKKIMIKVTRIKIIMYLESVFFLKIYYNKSFEMLGICSLPCYYHENNRISF